MIVREPFVSADDLLLSPVWIIQLQRTQKQLSIANTKPLGAQERFTQLKAEADLLVDRLKQSERNLTLTGAPPTQCPLTARSHHTAASAAAVCICRQQAEVGTGSTGGSGAQTA